MTLAPVASASEPGHVTACPFVLAGHPGSPAPGGPRGRPEHQPATSRELTA